MEYKWVVLTVTTIGIFMSTLDASIIIVGLPIVIDDLNTTFTAGIWIITGYRLVTTVLLVSIGRWADIVGRVKMYNFGFVIFTIGSAFCALSSDESTLIIFRLFQGVGSALLFANAIVIITDTFPTNELGMGIGINQVAINAGTIVGYTLSGIMISLFGWRSLFVINIPIGIFGTLWAHRRLKELHRRDHTEGFDLVGAAVFSTALTILLLAMTVSDIRTITTQIMIFISVLLFVLFFYMEKHVKYPVIDMGLFKIRIFTVGSFTNFLNNVTFGSLAFSMTLYFQLIEGHTPLQAGIALIPLDLAVIIVGPISGRLSDRFGARWLSTIGLAMNGLAFLMLTMLDAATNHVIIAAELALAGLGIGLFRSPNASSVMASVTSERRGIAGGVRSTILNLSMVLSIPVATLIMSLIIPYSSLSEIISGSTNQTDLVSFLTALKLAFIVFSALNFVAAIISPWRGAKIGQEYQ